MDNMQKLISSPLFLMGAGLLGARGQPSGLMDGLKLAQQANYQNALMGEMRRKQEEAMRQREEAAKAQDARTRYAKAMTATQIPGSGPISKNPQPAYALNPMAEDLATGYPEIMQKIIEAQALPVKEKKSNAALMADELGLSGNERAKFINDYAMKTSGTTVSLPPMENAYDKKLGESYAQKWLDINGAASTERKKLNTLNDIDRLLSGKYTGTGGEFVLEAQKLGKSIGVDIGDVGEKEAGRSIASQLALQYRNTANGEGMPGQMSDKDREFLMQMTPNLAMTEEGRKLLIEVQQRMYSRSVELQDIAHKYAKTHGNRLDAGFDIYVADHFAGQNLFEDLTIPEAEAQPGINASEMSDEELLRALGQ